MNCDQLSTITGFECAELASSMDRDGILSIDTPFKFFSGNPFSIFVAQHGPQIRLFDAGETLFELMNCGFKLEDRRRWRPIKGLIEPRGLSLTNDGEIECWSEIGSAPAAFAKYTSSLIAVADWQRENIGLPQESQWLIEEAEMYLRMWKPEPAKNMEKDVPLIGLSGRQHAFAFKLDSEYIDVVSSSPVATGGELRKLVDLRSKPAYADLPFRVIVDDRPDSKRANQEAIIIGRFANTWTMSDLMKSVPAISVTKQ